MEDCNNIKTLIASLDGQEKLLFSDPANPYESIYIRAAIFRGMLLVTDSECEHGPDGGWSHRTISFDGENTEKVLAFLRSRDSDPLRALAQMVGSSVRTRRFTDECDRRGIKYERRLSF